MPIHTVASQPSLRPLDRTATPAASAKKAPIINDVSGSARIALDVLLPIGTSIVADQLLKSSLKSGKAQAIVISFVGTAVAQAFAEGAVQVVKNKLDGQIWDHRVGIRALRGAQGGLFIAAGNLVGPAIQGKVAARFNTLNPILLVGVSNATAAVAGTAARLAADPDTWNKGAVAGVKRIGITSGISGGTAMIAGSGIKALGLIPAVKRVFNHLPYPFSG
ncbi:MAG: hypothetical protein H7338_10995 [Candidatus Sericytochromatia bacterium]|nr:hypothetical protein [Candidatus Sericytochromatia bacterium]